MKENLTDKQASTLFYLIDRNKITHSHVVEWAYAQFENDGVQQWIYKITLTINLHEIKEILLFEFEIHELDTSFELGVISYTFENDLISYRNAAIEVWYLLSDDKKWNKEEVSQSYLMEDYLQWHKNPKEVVTPILKKILKKHSKEYVSILKYFLIQ